ncbi:major facilitator superfamily domain-containing protein [Aspergillus bertholletiae]|uniref:Major facilitator superfamily domain-containing protein n=1 Tax=Aspergillus bertholletiae TaxID=1226010 RepID=A0A5N7B6R6_9EURO|nr:major facilitator superfamily domain-containing protein [Aspergillus bertholletiae]
MRLWPSGDGTSEPPVFLKWRSSKFFIIFVVVFAVFTDILLYGLIVPVTPTALHERVGLSENEEQKWTSILLALYGVALLAFSPVAGYIADRIVSRWWPLLIGLIALGAATALLCVGTHLGLWIAGRLFQGASAAVVWTVGCALLVDTVGKEELGQALGYIGMGMTLGTMGGPLLGGVLYEHGGYYAVFGLAFALIGLDIVFRIVMIEKKDAVKWLPPTELSSDGEKFDNEAISQAVTGSAAPATQKSDHDGEGSSEAVSPALSEGTQTLEKSTDHDNSNDSITTDSHPARAILTLLASHRMIVTIWAYFILSVALTSLDSVLPLYVEDIFHWEQTGQGLIFIPLCIPHIIDPLVGFINDKYPNLRRYIAAGALFATVPVIVCFRFVTEDSIRQKVLLCALLALLGFCLASLMPPILVEASYVVQEKEEKNPNIFGKGGAMALSYGILNAAFAAGTIVGPFFAGFIRENTGWGTMSWALALLTGVSAIPVLLFLGGFLFKVQKQVEPQSSV